jgi:hypothetical protein
MQTLLWCPIDLPKCSVFPKLEQDLTWYFWKVSKLTLTNNNPYSVTDFNNTVKNSYLNL